MKTYVKIMKRFHLPLLALALVMLVYFGVNGVQAQFESNEEKGEESDFQKKDLKIVAAATENGVAAAPTLTATPQETTSENEVRPQVVVKNIPAPTPEAKKQKTTTKINASRRAGNYIVDFKKGENAFDNLVRITKGDIQYTDWGGDLGVFIDCIGGLCRTDGYEYFWSLYINGKLSMVGASAYLVQPNDVIEWKYTEADYRY